MTGTGRAIFETSDGVMVYTGEFNGDNNLPNGFGDMEYPDERYWYGFVKDG